MKYRWNAKRRHGVHSPFVYELTDKCFRTPISSRFLELTQLLKKRLKRNPKKIQVTDHGAGSRKLGRIRTIGAIYNTNTSKGKYAKMLYQLMHHYQLQSALELGTSLGVGAAALSAGNPKAAITTIEGCPNIHHVAVENFNTLGLTEINAFCGTFSEKLPELADKKYDLIFIDGHHDGNALLNYIEQLVPSAHADTFFILDDIRWSKSMKEAWKKVQLDERFHVTIDLFRMGIALLRPQQEKEHFDILL